LTGEDWTPGENVNIVVDDEDGDVFERDVTVTADEYGSIRDEFQLPNTFVAVYSVVATGDKSQKAVSSFRDSYLYPLSITSPTLVEVRPGGIATYSVDVTVQAPAPTGRETEVSIRVDMSATGRPSNSTRASRPTRSSFHQMIRQRFGLASRMAISTTGR
jgi:hypothetical protein